LLTLKNRIIRSSAMTIVFSGCITLLYGILMLALYFYPSSLTFYIAFSIALLTWIFSIVTCKFSTI
jgi:hypothetical protein